VFGLFLELLLIRWIGTEIRIFAYLQNTVLVVCFLGLGMGCLTCRRPVLLREMLLPLLILVLLLAMPLTRFGLSRISEALSVIGNLLIWHEASRTGPVVTALAGLFGLGITLILMALVWDVFVPLGRLVGRLLNDHPRTIWAYSVNVVGSLCGVWLFVLLSALGQPPVVWFALVAIMLLILYRPARTRALETAMILGIVALAGVAGREPGSREVRWSAYQKLVLRDGKPSAESIEGIGRYLVTVNNVGYQGMLDLGEAHVAADPNRYPAKLRGLSQYDLPYLFHSGAHSALIVGAGSGNDAAGALRQNVERITAVEIDPAIIDLGRRYHPERPYDSPKVRLVNDDARSFFATTGDRYDVISFGLLDSHTTTAMTNARLDHYVYTLESLRHARTLLASGGVMTLSFEAQKPFIAERMAKALRDVFGEDPLGFWIPPSQYGWGGIMFVAGDLKGVRRQMAANPRLAKQVGEWQTAEPVHLAGTTGVVTDDWPYIYLETPSIPPLYVYLAGLLILLVARCSRRFGLRALVKGWDTTHWHFFFLGAAFLLLEVQNISKASVALGNTWQVSAVIISGILAMVLFANLIVARFPSIPTWPVYSGLFATCLVLYALDLSRFGFLPYFTKAAIVGGLTSLPMLFSGILFTRSFTLTGAKDKALGANLIGSLFGGLLQSVTFVTGIRALLLIVAGLYLAAYLTRTKVLARTHRAKLSGSHFAPSHTRSATSTAGSGTSH
jgi:spermidine synthase